MSIEFGINGYISESHELTEPEVETFARFNVMTFEQIILRFQVNNTLGKKRVYCYAK